MSRPSRATMSNVLFAAMSDIVRDMGQPLDHSPKELEGHGAEGAAGPECSRADAIISESDPVTTAAPHNSHLNSKLAG